MTTAQPSPADERAPVGELLNILRRRARVVLAAVVLATGAATLYGLLTEPKYTATASVMIDSRKNSVVDMKEVLPGLTTDRGTVESQVIETQISVVRSRDLIVQVMEELDLFNDPEFGTVQPEDVSSDRAASEGLVQGMTAWLRERPGAVKRLVSEWTPPRWLVKMGLARASDTELMSPEEAALAEQAGKETTIARFAGRLHVARSGSSSVLLISYTSLDPAKAARIANGIADVYIARELQERREATGRASRWLSERLRTMHNEVLEAERAIATFRAENELVTARGTALSEVQLADLHRMLIDARARKAETEAKLRIILELRASGEDLGSIAEAVASPVIGGLRQQEAQVIRQEAELRTSYGERHPQMQALREERADLAARIRDEVNRIVRSLENELSVLATREENLAEDLEAAKAESAVDNQAEVRLRELERDATARRTLYQTFLTRHQETRAQEDLLQADARIIVPAQVPWRPSTPSPKIFAAVGFTASAVFGSMLALLLEQLDRSVRSGRQVERVLQVPCLGLVPGVKGLGRKRTLHRYLRDRPRSTYTVAMRALYTATFLTEPDSAPKVVLVTSALSGEGKTSVASSLAVLAAGLGKRTLLIDLDLWHPSVAGEFGVNAASGIDEVLAGEQSVEQALIFDEATGIDILPVKWSHGDTLALLTSPWMPPLLRDVRKRYDCVVIDSPPLLGPSDAAILSLQVDATVFVVRWERTKQDAAVAGLKALRDVSANVVGAVLTQVDLKKHARYRYGDGAQYYGEYRKYYVD